jgi:Ca-activated chloride channel family protein
MYRLGAVALVLVVCVGCMAKKPMAPPPPPPATLHPLPALPPGPEPAEPALEGFSSAQVDSLSTFSIDVDTASYTAARRALVAGYLPAPAFVRAEEFVNYFPYTYAQPAEDDPLGVQGRHVPVERRQPAHLTFLVDISGSMRAPDKLDLVKDSLVMLTDALQDGDTVAVATYAGSTRVVLPPTPVSDKEQIVASLSRLVAGGSTAMGSGIELAYRLASDSHAPSHISRVIIASDGDANVGVTDPAKLSAFIHRHALQGITLTTLGFGEGTYNDVMMEQIANDGDGNYYYIDSLREARRVLVDQLTGTLTVIAKDVKIQVDFDPTVVEQYRLLGYDNRLLADEDFRDDRVDAGEIGAGHQVTALYELRLVPGAKGELGTVHVRNKGPGPDAPAVERRFALHSSEMCNELLQASADTRLAAAAAYFAEKLVGSTQMADVSYGELVALAQSAQRGREEDRELLGLIQMAGQLTGQLATRD